LSGSDGKPGWGEKLLEHLDKKIFYNTKNIKGDKEMTIGLLSCVKLHVNYKTTAEELYISPLFRKGLKYL